ncbi:MAG: high-potential iron-sulfur protein [Steroidobacteraceae bacterium]
MASDTNLSRRNLLKKGLLGATLAPLAMARLTTGLAAEAPLLSPDDPAAKNLKYTQDAAKAKGVPAGNKCATCALYQGADTSTQGPCQIFPGKQVKAAGWCSAWAPQM